MNMRPLGDMNTNCLVFRRYEYEALRRYEYALLVFRRCEYEAFKAGTTWWPC